MYLQPLNPLSKADFPADSVAYTGTAGNTDAVWGPAEYVLVFATTAAHVEVGEGAVATVASTPIPANVPVLIRVPKGTGAPWRVSAIQVASGGNVYAKPMNGV